MKLMFTNMKWSRALLMGAQCALVLLERGHVHAAVRSDPPQNGSAYVLDEGQHGRVVLSRASSGAARRDLGCRNGAPSDGSFRVLKHVLALLGHVERGAWLRLCDVPIVSPAELGVVLLL